MKVSVNQAKLSGSIKAIASKSYAHRLLICAALADKTTQIDCSSASADIDATVDCLNALVADISSNEHGLSVTPTVVQQASQLPCGESGSTYRFLLPVAAVLGANSSFVLEGRLPHRPMDALFTEMETHGIEIKGKGTALVNCIGKLSGGKYQILGNISSQFISGLLFALPLAEEDSEIELTGKIESKSYIDMTLEAIALFGIDATWQDNKLIIPGKQHYITPNKVIVEGDWSNAAFWLASAVISGTKITCNGLNPNSLQGDKAIVDLLERFGAKVTWLENGVSIEGSDLKGIEINVTNIPDLVPVLAVVAAHATGVTEIIGGSRLRFKESDRIKTIAETLNTLGAKVSENDDGLTIAGGVSLKGGHVDSHLDHRIAMMAAIACIDCENPVIIDRAEAVNKSYPQFFNDFASLGGVWERKEI